MTTGPGGKESNSFVHFWSLLINSTRLHVKSLFPSFPLFLMIGILAGTWNLFLSPLITGYFNNIIITTFLENAWRFAMAAIRVGFYVVLIRLTYNRLEANGNNDRMATGNSMNAIQRIGGFSILALLGFSVNVFYPDLDNDFFLLLMFVINLCFFILLVFYYLACVSFSLSRHQGVSKMLSGAAELVEGRWWRSLLLILINEFIIFGSTWIAAIIMDALNSQPLGVGFMIAKIIVMSIAAGIFSGLIPSSMLVMYHAWLLESGKIERAYLPPNLDLVIRIEPPRAIPPPDLAMDGRRILGSEIDPGNGGMQDPLDVAVHNKCPSCNKIIPFFHDSCQSCGLKIRRCSLCGTLLEDQDGLCDNCRESIMG
ncbi:hypothetical protein GF325_11630 [Candidatus Bathyarchaeota archaeon]|nr:hypothetical protein [Candidatus Bathyarchaeota archaeon]